MKMTIQEAARLMGVSEQFLRIGLQKGVFPFGYAVKMSGRWAYYISRERFEAETGIKMSGKRVMS